MERIRIGTNIGIVWHIFVSAELGESFILKDKEDSLKIYIRSPHDIYEVPYFTVDNDTIKLSFPGQFQRYTGVHALVLKDTTDGERTLCKDFAFELIKHLEEEGEAYEDNEEKKIISLNSSILVSKAGESAYEVWLRMGNTGSQEDFFNWLRGGTLVNFNFKKPLRSALSDDGVNYDVWLDGDALSDVVNGAFIRSDIDDEADGTITFNKGIIVGGALLNAVVKSSEIDSILNDNQIITANAVLKIIQKYLASLAEKYIRKDIDDEANGLITFLRGLKSDALAKFLSGMAVQGMATFSDSLSSPNFWTGWSGYGWKLWMRDTVNVINQTVKRATMEIDDLTVRGTFRVFEFVINQLRGENDNYIFSGMMKVDHVDYDSQTIYLDTNKGETYNPFREGDIIRCKRFKFGDNIAKQYDILVKEAQVGDISDGEDRVDYIVWENLDILAGEIEQGDVLCRLDSLTDSDRKGIIATTSIGNDAPYLDVLYGMITNPEGSLKVRLGRLDGIINDVMGSLEGFGLFSNNAYLSGKFYLYTGDSIETRIKMLENLFSSTMTKTTYDIKDENNIVLNCSFVNDMANWIKSADDTDFYFLDDELITLDDDVYSESRSEVTIENVQGKDMLHLLNSYVRQQNSLFVGRVPEDSEVEEYEKNDKGEIVKNEDGTPKIVTKTLRPTIYITYRYMCKQGGSLSIGFDNGRIVQYTSDMGVIVTVEELGLLTAETTSNDGVWVERQFKGYYDKRGDFVISATGEVYIDLLSVTSKPLDDFKNIVSTALIQTSGVIGLYGKNIKAAYDNIGGLTTSITELGVRVDANKEQVDIFLDKTYPADMKEVKNGITVNEQGISAVAKTVESNETRIGMLEVTDSRITSYVSKTRTAGAELVYNNTVTIRTTEENKTAVALDYVITPTFLIANEPQAISSIQVASDSISGNPRLVVTDDGLSVRVICGKDTLFVEPKLLEAVVTVTRKEEDVFGEEVSSTYDRSMFITVYPSTKGETGYRGAFKSTVFKRSLAKPDKPTGGTYDSPVPEGWSDGIPTVAEGEENYQIWASMKVMYDYPSSSDWSEPAPMSDSADFDVEFSSLESPSDPVGHPNTNKQWSNNADKDTIWMATSVCKNGVWTDWEVIKAKGEKGDPGRGVTSVNTFYALHTSLSATPSDGAFTYDTLSDVVISSNADMYVWSADKVTYSEGDPEFTGKYCIGKCSDLASVSEQYGTSSSATNEPTTWSDTYPQDIQSGSYIWTRDKITWKDGSMTYSAAQLSGQIPVGISSIENTYNVTATSTAKPTYWLSNSPAVTDENPFLWRKMVITYTNGTTKTDISLIGAKGSKGVDGTSVEYIYKLSTTESVPATPSTSQVDNYVPTGWSDDPQGVTSTNKFEYVSSRTKSNGVWSAFSTPSLWAKYSEDGKTGYGFVATVDRNNKFTEAQWNDTYGATGHTETWSDTSAIRNGCRVGDIFLVTGYATDTLNMHSAFYRSTTASGNLTGTCISHSVVARGQKGDTGAGEVWQLIDNGCYASVTAEEKLTLYLAYVVVYTIDGTSVSNTNYKVYWKANNKTDWHYASNGVMLNDVDFNKDATYKDTESFVVRLEYNNVAVGSITVPVKLAPGAAQIITENMIKTNVFGSDEWSSVKQTASEVKTEIENARGDKTTLVANLNAISSSISTVDDKVTTLKHTVDGIDLSVYAKIVDVNGAVKDLTTKIEAKQDKIDLSVYAEKTYVDTETGNIVKELSNSGIDIEAHKITISSTGQLVIDTTNFKLDEDGDVIIKGDITATSGKIGGFSIQSKSIYSDAMDKETQSPMIILDSSGKLYGRSVDIKGKITATSGEFDNCVVNETCTITKINATSGTIGGWNISANGLSTTNNTASLGVSYSGTKFARINSSVDPEYMLVVRNDGHGAASFTSYGDNGVALFLNAQAGDGSYALQSYGDVILEARAGEHIAVTGLSLSVIAVKSGGPIPSNADVVTFINSSAITVNMPDATTNKGKVLFMKRVFGSGSITLIGSLYHPGNMNTPDSDTEWVNGNKSMMFVSDGKRWIAFYCG